jgi:hypothetical protein
MELHSKVGVGKSITANPAVTLAKMGFSENT